MLFDLLANNADRKGSHVFFEEGTHKLFAIDHGICFHEDDKLRTVIWDFAAQQIPVNRSRLFPKLTIGPLFLSNISARARSQRY